MSSHGAEPCSCCCWQLDIQFSYMVLCRCKNVHDEGFAGLASLTGLTALDVSECATLSDVGLGALVDKLVGLQELNLHGCIHVTDAGERSIKMGTCRATVKGAFTRCHLCGEHGTNHRVVSVDAEQAQQTAAAHLASSPCAHPRAALVACRLLLPT